MFWYLKTLSVLALMSSLGLFAAPGAWAQTANKLKCNGCVKSKQIKNDGIKSKDIKDGDVLNSDLGANAVTGDKIAIGAVGGVNLALDAVTSNKIVDGAVANSDLADDAVDGSKVDDFSLTGRDIAEGAIGAAQLGLANTHYIEDLGSPQGNCSSVIAHLAGLTGPAAVVLGPGTYGCGGASVILGPGISLIGAGESLTTITGRTSAGLVRLQGDDITLRDLTVINDGDGGTAVSTQAVVIGADGVFTRNWRISNVTAVAKDAGFLSVGISTWSLPCEGGRMTNVTSVASGAGTDNVAVQISCTLESLTASNLTAKASDAGSIGLEKRNGASLTVRNSSLAGDAISAELTGGTLRVISTELDGLLVGAVKCVGAYDDDGDALVDGSLGDGLGGCELPP